MAKRVDRLPGRARDIAAEHPPVWRAYAALGKACAEAGPLDAHAIRLVKLAIAIGAGLEGGVHSHTRRALDEGATVEELRHVAMLAIPTLGLPSAARALSWIDDLAAQEPASNEGAEPSNGRA